MSESEGELMPAPLDPERRRQMRSAMKYLTVGGGEEGAFACDVLALLDECDRLREVVERVEEIAGLHERTAVVLAGAKDPAKQGACRTHVRAAADLRSALAGEPFVRSALAAAPEQGGQR